MYAVSASRTMANAKPKHVESDVVVRDILQVREERRREAERQAEEQRRAQLEEQLETARRAVEAYRQEEDRRRRELAAEAQRKRAEYLADVSGGSRVCVHTYREIERRALKLFRLRRTELHSNRRNRDIVFARQFVMYWTCRLTDRSLPQIGRLMGGLDHTTVHHGRKAYREKRWKMGRILRPDRSTADRRTA